MIALEWPINDRANDKTIFEYFAQMLYSMLLNKQFGNLIVSDLGVTTIFVIVLCVIPTKIFKLCAISYTFTIRPY